MAISWAASLPAVGANNGGNVTLTFSNFVNAAGGAYALVEGDIVIAAYASSGTADAAMSTSSSGWTELTEHYSDGTIDTNIAVYGKQMTASPDTSIVLVGPGGASNGTMGVAHVIKGATLTDIATALAAGTATSVPNPGAITPGFSGSFIAVIGAGAAAAGATFTNTDLNATTNHWRTGNHAETNDIAIGFGWKEDWTSGSFDPAVWGGGNVNAANSWAAITVAIKPAPTPTTVSVTAASVNLSEQALIVNASLKLAAANAAVNLTPHPVTIPADTRIFIDAGSLALTGQNLIVSTIQRVVIAVAQVALTAQNILLVAAGGGRRLFARLCYGFRVGF